MRQYFVREVRKSPSLASFSTKCEKCIYLYISIFFAFALTVLPNRNNRNDYFSVLQKENKKATQHKLGSIAHPFSFIV